MDAAVKQVMTIHLSFPVGDILVFMTGQEDIEATCQVIAERCAALGKYCIYRTLAQWSAWTPSPPRPHYHPCPHRLHHFLRLFA